MRFIHKTKNRAQKRRPRARTQLSLLIDESVLGNPNISKDELEVELLTHDGIEITDEELRDTNNAETIRISALKDQLTRAKKKFAPTRLARFQPCNCDLMFKQHHEESRCYMQIYLSLKTSQIQLWLEKS